MMTELTQRELKELLDYNPETGVFTWRKDRGNYSCAGKVAGSFDKRSGYIRIGIKDRRYLVSRLAWLWKTGKWPNSILDHVNMDRTDNRWRNLREANYTQNRANTMARINNSTGIKGVKKRKNGSFEARVTINGKYKHLGVFSDAKDAEAAYLQAAHILFGEFARGG